MKKIPSTLLFLLIPFHNVHAFDESCEPLIKAYEASANATSWQKINTVMGEKNFKMEIRKINGQFYTFTGDEWKQQPPSFGEAVKDFAEQTRSGAIKLTQCKDEGSETIDGINTNVMSFRIEMTGAPAANGKVFIGKEDGLPYAESSASTQSSYSYKNVIVPTLK